MQTLIIGTIHLLHISRALVTDYEFKIKRSEKKSNNEKKNEFPAR